MAWALPSLDCCCSALPITTAYLLIAAALVGWDRRVYPESARIARLASGGRTACAIGCFSSRQLWHIDGPGAGGADRGAVRQPSIAWFFPDRLWVAIVTLWRIGVWYKPQISGTRSIAVEFIPIIHSRRVMIALGVLVALVFKAALCLKSVELLNLLSDRQIRRIDAGSAALSVHLPLPPTRWAHSSADRSAIASAANMSSGFLNPRRAAVHAALPYAGCSKRGADVSSA